MAYSSHKHHSQQKVSAHRVKHLLASGGCAPKKAKGGGVGTGGGQAEAKAEKALNAMHANKDMHEAYAEGGAPKRRYARGGPARGNDSEAVMSAEASPTYKEGVANSHRIPKAKGGSASGGKRVGRPTTVNIIHAHIHGHPHNMLGGGPGLVPGPQMAPGAPVAPGPGIVAPPGGLPQGLPTGAPGVPMRARGGSASGGKRTKAGAFSGVGRLQMFHEMGGED
jgi:hypothetical protein